MDSKNSRDIPIFIKEEFKDWLKKYHAELKARNETLSSKVIAKQQRNNALKAKIQSLANKLILNPIESSDTITSAVESKTKDMVHSLKTKEEQLNKYKETIEEKVEQDINEMRKQLYELTIIDDITIKPFHEVESAINELNKQISAMEQQHNMEQETFITYQRKREQQYIDLHETISVLEPLQEEIKHDVERAQLSLAHKLKSLKLKSVEGATMESPAAKELLNDIEIMKSKLNKI